MKLTEWYPENIKPVRIGVYNTSGYEASNVYQYWDGSRWAYYMPSVEKAIQSKRSRSHQQNVKWRGIAK